MSRQAVQDVRSHEAQRKADERSRKKERKEKKRKKVDANNVKRVKKGGKNAIYNPSRVFTTPTPTFEVRQGCTS